LQRIGISEPLIDNSPLHSCRATAEPQGSAAMPIEDRTNDR